MLGNTRFGKQKQFSCTNALRVENYAHGIDGETIKVAWNEEEI